MVLELKANFQDVEGCDAEAGDEACGCTGEDDLDVRALDIVSLCNGKRWLLLCTSSRRGAAAEDIHPVEETENPVLLERRRSSTPYQAMLHEAWVEAAK
jgi:hypothetical protein